MKRVEAENNLSDIHFWVSGAAAPVVAKRLGLDPQDEGFQAAYQTFVEETVKGASVTKYLSTRFEHFMRNDQKPTPQQA